MKFTNTLKTNVQLGEEINGTKGTKQLQNKKTNIEHKTASLSQLINRVDDPARIEKIYSPPTVA